MKQNSAKPSLSVDMDVKGKTEVTTHPLEVIRDLRVVRGLFKDILTNPSGTLKIISLSFWKMME
jgi:hypothetical protein